MDTTTFQKLSPHNQAHFLVNCFLCDKTIEEEWVTHFRKQTIDLDSFDFGDVFYRGLQFLYTGELHSEYVIESPYQLTMIQTYGNQPLTYYIPQFSPIDKLFDNFSIVHDNPEFEYELLVYWLSPQHRSNVHNKDYFMHFILQSPHCADHINKLTLQQRSAFVRYMHLLHTKHPLYAKLPQPILFQYVVEDNRHDCFSMLRPGLSLLAQIIIHNKEHLSPLERLIYTPDLMTIDDAGEPLSLSTNELKMLFLSKDSELLTLLSFEDVDIFGKIDWMSVLHIILTQYDNILSIRPIMDELPLSF